MTAKLRMNPHILIADFIAIDKFGLMSMVLEPVCCPRYGSDDVGKHGESREGKKR